MILLSPSRIFSLQILVKGWHLCIKLSPYTDMWLVAGPQVVYVILAVWPSWSCWNCQSCRSSCEDSCSPPLQLAGRCKRRWRVRYWTVESSVRPEMGSEFQATHMLNSDEICASERDVRLIWRKVRTMREWSIRGIRTVRRLVKRVSCSCRYNVRAL